MLRSTQSSIPVLLKVWSAARYRGRGGLVTGPQIDTKILFCTMQCENMVYSFILTLKYIKCYIMINILQLIEALIIIVSSPTSIFIKIKFNYKGPRSYGSQGNRSATQESLRITVLFHIHIAYLYCS